MRPLEAGDIFPRGAIYGALPTREIPGRVIPPRAALMRPLETGDIFPRGAIYGALPAREIPGRVIPPKGRINAAPTGR